MVRLGVDLDSESLALACASHSGTDRHLAVVRRSLAGAGLDESALLNTPGLPLDRGAADALLAAGGRRDPIHMNCSGKHAAMVATCVANGWDVAGYLAAEHPLQLAITARIADLAGRRPPHRCRRLREPGTRRVVAWGWQKRSGRWRWPAGRSGRR